MVRGSYCTGQAGREATQEIVVPEEDVEVEEVPKSLMEVGNPCILFIHIA